MTDRELYDLIIRIRMVADKRKKAGQIDELRTLSVKLYNEWKRRMREEPTDPGYGWP